MIAFVKRIGLWILSSHSLFCERSDTPSTDARWLCQLCIKLSNVHHAPAPDDVYSKMDVKMCHFTLNDFNTSGFECTIILFLWNTFILQIKLYTSTINIPKCTSQPKWGVCSRRHSCPCTLSSTTCTSGFSHFPQIDYIHLPQYVLQIPQATYLRNQHQQQFPGSNEENEGIEIVVSALLCSFHVEICFRRSLKNRQWSFPNQTTAIK